MHRALRALRARAAKVADEIATRVIVWLVVLVAAAVPGYCVIFDGDVPSSAPDADTGTEREVAAETSQATNESTALADGPEATGAAAAAPLRGAPPTSGSRLASTQAQQTPRLNTSNAMTSTPIDTAELQERYFADVTPGGCEAAVENMAADQWCFFVGYSTSYVAWRLNSAHDWDTVFANRSPPRAPEPVWGHAADWHKKAAQLDGVISMRPAVGHVAAWTRANMPPYGRVGFIERVDVTQEGEVTAVVVSTMTDGEVVVSTETCTEFGTGLQCGTISWFFDLDGHFSNETP